jgi:hypothetical protein
LKLKRTIGGKSPAPSPPRFAQLRDLDERSQSNHCLLAEPGSKEQR